MDLTCATWGHRVKAIRSAAFTSAESACPKEMTAAMKAVPSIQVISMVNVRDTKQTISRPKSLSQLFNLFSGQGHSKKFLNKGHYLE